MQPNANHNASQARRWWILAVIGLAQLMVVLDATIVNIALPSAQHDLGFADDARQWVITAYALAFAGASAVGGVADSFGMLIVARALQGAFGALLAPAALSILTSTFRDSP